MPKCPVCDTQYNEVAAEDSSKYCHSCGWNLKLYSLNKPLSGFEEVLEKKPELLQQIEVWARKNWEKQKEQKQQLKEANKNYEEFQGKLNKVTQERDELKTRLSQLEAQPKKDIDSPLTQENDDLTRQEVNKLVGEFRKQIQELREKQNSGDQNLFVIKEELEGLKDNVNKLEERFTPIEDFAKLKEVVETCEADLKSITNNYQQGTPTQSIHQDQQTLKQSSLKNDLEKPLTHEESKLVNEYQHNKENLSKIATEVNVAQGTIGANRVGNQEVFLEKTLRGNYWIINWEGYKYLVVSKNIRLNQHNISTIEALFECWGYPSANSKDFQLVKPAKVSELPESETWKLVDRGILRFYSID